MIIKLITLALMASFYACYFAKMMSQRRQGIATDQLGKGKQGFTKFIELALKVTTYVIPMVQIISILLYAGTLHILVRIAGIMLTAVGVIVFVISVAQMKDNWRAGVQREEKTNLVTTGIYSVSRNPAFLGFDVHRDFAFVFQLVFMFSYNLCTCVLPFADSKRRRGVFDSGFWRRVSAIQENSVQISWKKAKKVE